MIKYIIYIQTIYTIREYLYICAYTWKIMLMIITIISKILEKSLHTLKNQKSQAR